MVFSRLYTYITSPKRVLLLHDAISIRKEALFVFFLVGMANALGFSPVSFTAYFTSVFLCWGLLILVLVAESMFWDFCAQSIFKTSGQSWKLFQWMMVAMLPSLMAVPGNLLIRAGGVFYILGLIAHGVGIYLVFYLQVKTISTLYGLRWWSSLGVYVAPFILIFLSFFALAVLGISQLGGF